jgi:hypothetical protein
MRGFPDEMAATRKPLDDDDIISYILNGLDADYNSLIEHVNGMVVPISPETLYSHLSDGTAGSEGSQLDDGQHGGSRWQ